MGIGVALFLIAIGAILTFATDVSVSGLDLDVVGIVLMIVGIVGLALTLAVWGPRRRATRVERVERGVVPPPAAPRREIVEERRVYDDPL